MKRHCAYTTNNIERITNVNTSKIILTGGLGRVGSSIFDDVLTRSNNLENYYELLQYPTETPEHFQDWHPPGGREGALQLLSTIENWCLTIWIQDTYNFPHIEEFARLDPTLVINLYRENMFEQFLSWRIAEKNLMWNDVKKFNYNPIEITQDEVDYFLRSKEKAKKIIQQLRDKYHVIDISYEQIISHQVPDGLNIVDWNFKLAKQTTFGEKCKLVTNFNELKSIWSNSLLLYDI